MRLCAALAAKASLKSLLARSSGHLAQTWIQDKDNKLAKNTKVERTSAPSWRLQAKDHSHKRAKERPARVEALLTRRSPR